MNAAAATDMQTAETVLAQLGGGRFLAMTGARNVLGLPNGLQFKLPARFAKDGINSVRVTVNALDLYTVEFHKIGRAPRFEVTEVASFDMVDADSLRGVFTSATGLDTGL